MKNKIAFNDMEIGYDEALVEKVRKTYNIPASASVSEEQIISFFQETMKSAIGKGYAVIEKDSETQVGFQ